MPKTNALIDIVWDSLATGDGASLIPDNWKLGLFTSIDDTKAETDLARYVNSAVAQYPSQAAPGLYDPSKRLDGRSTLDIGPVRFDANVAALNVTFLGWYLLDSTAPAKVLAYSLFATPVIFIAVGNAASIIARLSISNPPADVETVVVNG